MGTSLDSEDRDSRAGFLVPEVMIASMTFGTARLALGA
jgi:hypothetical protein